MEHPYRRLPAKAFWKRAVSLGWEPDTVPVDRVIVRTGDVVASAGSCFAANLVPYIEKAGFRYSRAPGLRSVFGPLADDNYGYSRFSAAYGNIYTVRQAVQLLLRAMNRFRPIEDRWILNHDTIVDPFRPGLRYSAASDTEFDLLTAQYLNDVLDAFGSADVFIFTLGLTEAWISKADGAVFPVCPGTVGGEYDPERHAFHNFNFVEVSADLDQFIALAREINPSLRIVLTVSPVPLVATATGCHVITASSYSKAVLRAAAGEAAGRHPDVAYFPAYEIVTGPQAPSDFFEPDRREPSLKAIQHVMHAFLVHCETDFRPNTENGDAIEPIPEQATANERNLTLSRVLTDAECEEVAAGF